MITISNLKKQFGETVACDIPELEIKDGEILGLVGNNGAGKTTLFRMLLDLLKPDAGTVALDGINPTESEAWKDKTGAYIDDSFLIEFLTPEEYFAFLGKISDISQEEVEARLKPFERFASGEGTMADIELIRSMDSYMKMSCFCPLGQSATTAFMSALKLFPEDFDAKLRKEA